MITVMTSIIGGYDTLKENQEKGRAEFVCYTDRPIESDTWTVKPAYSYFKSDRINSRVPKMLGHKFVGLDTDWIIWMDGTMELKVPPEEIIPYAEKGIAVFEHRHMGDWEPFHVYKEMDYCSRFNGDPTVILDQKRRYLKEGVSDKDRTISGGFIVRKVCPEINQLFEAWWGEFTRYPSRDQISMYKIFNNKVSFIPGQLEHSDLVTLGHHL